MDASEGFYVDSHLHSHSHSHSYSRPIEDSPLLHELENSSNRLLTIRAADTDGHRSSAQILVNRMYSGRGYTSSAMADSRSDNCITLIASEHKKTVGTITVSFDGDDGMHVDQSFADHVDRLRAEGKVLCEFVKFAIDNVVGSRKVLASLMHSALICAREDRGCDVVLIEVNPRHVRYYESMLGFRVIEGGRHNHRVNAPAVLMSLDMAFAHEQICVALRDQPSCERERRSIYREFFSNDEAHGVAARFAAMRRGHRAPC